MAPVSEPVFGSWPARLPRIGGVREGIFTWRLDLSAVRVTLGKGLHSDYNWSASPCTRLQIDLVA